RLDPIVLRRFIKCMDYDVKKTKALIELNYNLRNKNCNIYIDRDMNDEKTAQALKASDVVLLPGVTPERHRLLVFRMADYDPRSVTITIPTFVSSLLNTMLHDLCAQRNSEQEAKVFFMLSDTRFTEPDIQLDQLDDVMEVDEDAEGKSGSYRPDADLADGDVHIVDIKGYTMRHLAYVSIFVLRVQMKFLQEAYPSRLKAIHFINCPSFLDRMLTIMRPFIREEILQLVSQSRYKSNSNCSNHFSLFQMHYHVDGMESLYELIPRDMLPNEYGGKAGSMDELKAQWLQKLDENTPYLQDDKYWRITSASKSRWSWF
ncbi:hypothetical protein KR093_003475, partial [Drosophila rubida]